MRAQRFIQQSPDDAKTLFGNRTGLTPESVETIWHDRSYELFFNHIMLATLEDHARWMLKKDAVDAKTILNFLNTIQTDLLQSLDPKSVNLMR